MMCIVSSGEFNRRKHYWKCSSKSNFDVVQFLETVTVHIAWNWNFRKFALSKPVNNANGLPIKTRPINTIIAHYCSNFVDSVFFHYETRWNGVCKCFYFTQAPCRGIDVSKPNKLFWLDSICYYSAWTTADYNILLQAITLVFPLVRNRNKRWKLIGV